MNLRGAFDSTDFHLHPFTRLPSLLNFARVILPEKHTFSHSNVGRNKFHSFSKISASVFSLLDFIGVLPLRVTCVFPTVAALRINWAGVICDRVVSSKFLVAGSTSAERNFLYNRTPISARFGQDVCGRKGNLLKLSRYHRMEITFLGLPPVAFHSSLVSGTSGLRSTWLLLCLCSFCRVTSAWYWFCLWVSLMLFVG